MKKRPTNQLTGASFPAILVTLCLAGSPALAADYFHLGVDETRIGIAANYSNTNGGATAATINPGSADNLFFFNSTAGADPADRRLEVGASALSFNSMTFGSNAGTTQIDRGAAPGSKAATVTSIGAGGITIASGAGPVTFGRLASSGNDQRVVVGAVANHTVANHSSNDLTFSREFDGRGTQQHTVTVAGTGDGDTIFNQILSYDSARDLAMTINKPSGSGVVRFDGTNTYTGATTVTAGTLLIKGSTHAASAVSVASGAALGGDGTVGGSATFENGSIFGWNLSVTEPENSASATVADTFSVTGNLVDGGSAGASVFKVLLAGKQTFADTFWTANHSWSDVLTSGNSAALETVFTSFSYANADGAINPASYGSFSFSGNTLTFKAIPK